MQTSNFRDLLVLPTPERLNKDNNCYYSSHCSRFYICQAEFPFHPFGKCRQDRPPALQHFPVQVPKSWNVTCSEAAVEDVPGIALPVDTNPCFNHQATSPCCASSMLRGSGMIAQGVWLIHPPGTLIRIMAYGIWGQLNDHREPLLRVPSTFLCPG